MRSSSIKNLQRSTICNVLLVFVSVVGWDIKHIIQDETVVLFKCPKNLKCHGVKYFIKHSSITLLENNLVIQIF